MDQISKVDSFLETDPAGFLLLVNKIGPSGQRTDTKGEALSKGILREAALFWSRRGSVSHTGESVSPTGLTLQGLLRLRLPARPFPSVKEKLHWTLVKNGKRDFI